MIMKELNEQTVIMTAEERAEFEAFQREKAKKAAEEKAKADREMYKQMVDEEIENSIPVLLGISEEIKESKQKVLDNFKAILAMKSDLFKTKMRNDQRSHTFTNSAGDKRITLGVYVTDGYRDTVEDGIAIVKEYIASLANDEKTQALVNMVFRLLSRDAKGTLKASRAAAQGGRRYRRRTVHGGCAHYRGELPAGGEQAVYPRRDERQERHVEAHTAGNDRIVKNRS